LIQIYNLGQVIAQRINRQRRLPIVRNRPALIMWSGGETQASNSKATRRFVSLADANGGRAGSPQRRGFHPELDCGDNPAFSALENGGMRVLFRPTLADAATRAQRRRTSPAALASFPVSPYYGKLAEACPGTGAMVTLRQDAQ
jgi:hypothetical protein